MHSVRINEGAFEGVGDSAVHTVAFPGDVSGNRDYGGYDAALTARVSVGLETGFSAYPLVDPRIIADVSGDKEITAYDAALIARKAVDLPVPLIRALALDNAPETRSVGLDRIVSIPTDLQVSPGSSVNATVNIDDATGLLACGFQVRYDTGMLDLSNADVSLGNLTKGGWSMAVNATDASGLVRISMFTIYSLTGGSGSLVNLTFHVPDDVWGGSSAIALAGQLWATSSKLAMTVVPGTVEVAIPGTTGDDTWYLRLDDEKKLAQLFNSDTPIGTPLHTRPSSCAGEIAFNGLSGDDELTIDYTNGDPIPPDGITCNGGSGNNLVFATGLGMAPGGKLDLTDNDMIVPATAATRAAVYQSVFNWIKAARADGAWTGKGLTSSEAAKHAAEQKPYTGLAAIINDKGDGSVFHAKFASVDVGSNDVLVKYTYNGDANVDGVVNADDYFQIDQGYISHKGGYHNGDFNYDGVVNADDYFLIDSAFLGQTGPLATKPRPVETPAAEAADESDEDTLVLRASQPNAGVFATKAGDWLRDLLGSEERVLSAAE